MEMLYRFARLIDPEAEKWVKSKVGNSMPKQGSDMEFEETTFGNQHLQLRYSPAEVNLRAEAK